MQASDVYAFAIICWHLVSQGDTFFERNLGNLYVSIVDESQRPILPTDTNSAFVALVQSCWQADPIQRPPFTQIRNKLEDLYNEINL